MGFDDAPRMEGSRPFADVIPDLTGKGSTQSDNHSITRSCGKELDCIRIERGHRVFYCACKLKVVSKAVGGMSTFSAIIEENGVGGRRRK